VVVLNNKYMRELSIGLSNPIAAELKSMEGDFVLYLIHLVVLVLNDLRIAEDHYHVI
jgi:hypothetical protein